MTRFYDEGRKSCLLETLSLGTPGEDAGRSLKLAADAWIEAFASVARLAGSSRARALARAQDAVASIEGALVLARVTGDNRPFLRAVDRLSQTLGIDEA